MDPLELLLQVCPPQQERINNLVSGQLYTALVLDTGEMGVCANLTYHPMINTGWISAPDLSNPSHRIVLIAYYNALFNSAVKPDAYQDIFAHQDFRRSGRLVMIGFFRPLVAKFDQAGIPLTVFDIAQEDERLEPYSNLEGSLKAADRVIITSTTLVNNTYPYLTGLLRETAEVYMLGPSTILHEALFAAGKVKALYGMQFGKSDKRVLEVIRNDGGTSDFSKYSTKVCLLDK